MRRFTGLAVAALFPLAILATPGCSKDSRSPTNPGTPGGGTSFNSGIMPPGASWSRVFPAAGTFGYHCGVHPAVMTGNTVNVVASSTVDSVVVNIVGTSTPGFSPSAATIKPGGTIRWVNVHGVNHSVVSD